jgi:hypothetical protein
VKTISTNLNKFILSIGLIFTISLIALLAKDSSLLSKDGDQAVQAAPSIAVTIYLPFTVNRYPMNTIFGMETVPAEKGFSSVVDLKSSWIRYNGLRWSSVESYKGERNWVTVEELEASLLRASQKGIEPILIVRSTPAWAQAIAGAPCGPIKSDEIVSFGQFMYDAVMRYSQPPYNVNYWEIWNEPDTAYVPDMANQPFGCWGNYDDEYFGGGYYAEVLKVVYPYMKAANEDIKILIGGLLLDCDPGPDPNICSLVGHNDRPPKYLEGILLNGGGAYFDGVSFHAYDYFPYYAPTLGEFSNANWGAAWNTTGPVAKLKAAFLRDVLAQYDIYGKFLINTEAALICGPDGISAGSEGCEATNDSLYEQTKARYVVQSYTTSMADGLLSNIWFSLYGWRNSGLLYSDSTPRPAYDAYKFARKELQDASFQQTISMDPNVIAYQFYRHSRYVWVMWSLDGATHTITLPGAPAFYYNFLGNPLTPSEVIDVTLDPIYLEWYP